MNINKAGVQSVGILALCLALPVSAVGQQTANNTDGNRAIALARANTFREAAEHLYAAGADNWDEVARLHLKAEKIAPRDDPGRVHDLWMAAVALEAIGNREDAQRHMETAAGLAEDMKEYFQAGECYLAAAILAARAGELQAAHHLLQHATQVADPELMGQDQCDCLRQRIAMLRGKGG